MTAFESSPDEGLFPSGEWTGFYVQNGERHRQDLVLTFGNGFVRGSGGDGVGGFGIRGRYDAATLEVVWTKVYLGAHSVYYRGFREGKGIWGTWEIGSYCRGGFQIWPKRAGEAVAATQAEAEPAAATAGGSGALTAGSAVRPRPNC